MRALGHILSRMNVLLFQPGNNAWDLGRRMLKRKLLTPFCQNLLGKYLLKIATVQKLE